jgi:DNA modification methylase
LWLNLGDAYSRHERFGAIPKSLLLGPERVARALTADGWLLRNKVVWAKTNPMPSSIRDRLTASHELVYFLTRAPHYYFNLDAIRQPLRTSQRQTTTDPLRRYPPLAASPPQRVANANQGLSRLKAAGRAGHPRGKNPGDVWSLATASFRGGHFAVFPLPLAERPLLATCPAAVCQACGRPQPPACDCRVGSRPGLVLDPFMGTGTTALAAERHGRDWLGIELNPAYAALAEQRLTAARAARPTKQAHGPPPLAAPRPPST